jgi:hypothetical protein
MIENTRRVVVCWFMVLGAVISGCGGGGGSGNGGAVGNGGRIPLIDGSATGGERNAVCLAGTSAGEVARPQFLMNLEGQTGWYASPVVADLDQDGRNELVAASYRSRAEPSHRLGLPAEPDRPYAGGRRSAARPAFHSGSARPAP